MTKVQAKEKAKNKIKELIEKYQGLSPERIKGYGESNTRKDFVLPLFEALSWDIRNTKEDEVIEEEAVSGKRVDYAFKINGITKFYLEAKALSIDLNEEKWAEQAIWYAWHKGVAWVILTDFESIKLYNAEWDEPNPENSLFFEIKYQNYLNDLERLWWLSKESFQKGILDSEALKWGHKPKRIPVDKSLATDLIEWRELLRKELEADNPLVSQEKISESVQRILDRLIFIRTAEDRNMEERVLQPIARNWQDSEKSKPGDLIKELNKLFREYDGYYNSKLFRPHLCEELTADDNIYVSVIEQLYKNSKGIRYNFADIDVDVFGSIYEQYLGFIQKEDSRDKNKKSKRKSQGIYYTPRYIVDYIVKNTLGEILKKESPKKIRDIRILDPACGSGSFLIRAFKELVDYWQNKKGKDLKYGKDTHLGKLEKSFKMRKSQEKLGLVFKMGLLRNNIYGVDLDKEAVEIAQLNLLLRVLERRQILPDLSHKIACGNSLISGTEKELKKYFSKDWKKKKAFNWQEKFPEVFKQGGFDVIIGNPPYLKEMDNKNIFEPIKNSDYRKYYQGKMDFWYFFLHRAIDVTKENGFIGFITNSYFLKSAGASKLIERIKKELVLIKVVDLNNIKIFGDVSGKHIIHIYQKRQANKTDKTALISVPNDNFTNFIDEKNKKEIFYNKLIIDNKINFETAEVDFKNCVFLGNVYDVSQGVVEATDKISKKQVITNNNFKMGDGVFVLSKTEIGGLYLNSEEKQLIKKYLNTNNIGKYFISFNDEYLIYSDKEARQKIADGSYLNIKSHLDRMKKFITSSNKPYGLHRPRENRYFENPKLICKGMFLSPEFCYDEAGYYVGFSFSVIIQKDKNYSLKYLLGILNSKLGGYWFNNNAKKRGVGVDVGVLVFRKFPVKKADINQQKSIEVKVNKILKLNKKLQKLDPKLDDEEYNELKEKIAKTDKKIDEEVYNLYGLTEREIKIIEAK